MKAFAASGGNRIIVPHFRGGRGNPVVIPAPFIGSMRLEGRNLACRNFIDRNPQLTQSYAAENDHFIIDIDTSEDLAAPEARLLFTSLTETADRK
jgi:molybdenum cofactor cytidylyltransferase